MDDMQEILEDFLVEAFELIEQIDHDLIELEARPDDLELLNSIFRVAHTVKGSSSFLNFDVLTKLTHKMEDVLNKARHGELQITPDIMDVVLESVDKMKTLLNCIRDNGNDTAIGMDIEPICARLAAVADGTAVQNSPTPEQSTPQAATPEQATPSEPAQTASAQAAPEQAAPSMANHPDIDVNSLSDAEVEAEIERLLKIRKAEDTARRAQKAQNPAAPSPAPKPAPKPATPPPAAKKVPAAGGANRLEERRQRLRPRADGALPNASSDAIARPPVARGPRALRRAGSEVGRPRPAGPRRGRKRAPRQGPGVWPPSRRR